MERAVFLSKRKFTSSMEKNPVISDGINVDSLSVGQIHLRYSTSEKRNLNTSNGTTGTSTSSTTVLTTTLTSKITTSDKTNTNTVKLDSENLTLATRTSVLGVKTKTTKVLKCKPKQHIGFVKVHKAASTSMHIMFYRYALENNLTPMLFIRDPFPFARFEENLLQFPNKSTLRNFDIMVEHSK